MVRANFVPLKMEATTVTELSKRITTLPEAYKMPVIAPQYNPSHLKMFKDYEVAKTALLDKLGPMPGSTEKEAAQLKAWAEAWDDGLNQTAYGEFLNGKYFEELMDPVTKFWGVFVEGECVNMVSARYEVVQHHEALGKVLEVIREKVGAENVKAYMNNTDTAAYLYVILPEKYTIMEADGGRIDVGFMAVNSHDSTHSVDISGFGFRQVCTNGMVSKQVLGHIRASHIGDVKHKLSQWVDQFSLKIEDLSKRITLAQQVGVTREEAEAYFRDTGKGVKFVQRAMMLWDEVYSKRLNSSAWALYNVATDMYSHQSTNLQDMAVDLAKPEKLLVAPMIQVGELRSHAARYREDDRKKSQENDEKARREAYPGAFPGQEPKVRKAKPEAVEPVQEPAPEPETVDFSQAEPLPSAMPEPETPAPETLETPDSEFERVMNVSDLPDEKDEPKEKKDKEDKKKKNGKNGKKGK